MKLNHSLWLTLLLLVASAGTIQAQQKIGYFDSEFVLSKLPDYSGVEQRLGALVQTWNTEIAELEKEIDDLKKDLAAKEILYTEQVRKEKREEIDTKVTERDRLVQTKYGPEGEYYRTQATLLEPIQQRILQAVQTIAERDNYDYVFDRSGDYVFIYTKQQWNLSNAVLLELGIEVEPTNR